MVRTAWLYVRALVYRHQPELREVEDKLLVRFLFSRESSDAEVVWLLANYMDVVQQQCVARGSAVSVMGMRGRLLERLRMMKGRAVHCAAASGDDKLITVLVSDNVDREPEIPWLNSPI